MKHEISKTTLRWAIYGISVAALLFVLAAAYIIVRVADGNWANWQLPVILAVVWLTLVIVSAMVVAIPEIKSEIAKELAKNKEKNKSE